MNPARCFWTTWTFVAPKLDDGNAERPGHRSKKSGSFPAAAAGPSSTTSLEEFVVFGCQESGHRNLYQLVNGDAMAICRGFCWSRVEQLLEYCWSTMIYRDQTESVTHYSRVRPQWVNHPSSRSQLPSTAPLGVRGDCPAACLVGHQSDMVSLGLVQGCFKVYWGLFRVGFRFGFRVGLRFLQGFLMVLFWGLFRVDLVLVWGYLQKGAWGGWRSAHCRNACFSTPPHMTMPQHKKITEKTIKTKMQHVRLHAQLLEERSMECYFVWFVFFCFSMVLASLPQMQKPSKKKQKQNDRHHAQLWDWRRGPWNLPFFVFSRFWSVSQKCKRFLQWDMGEEQLSSKWFPDKPFQYQFLLLSAQLLLWYQIDFAECNRLASSAAIWYHILSSYSIAEFLLCHALVLRQSHRRIQCQSLIVLYRSSTWYSLSFCTLRCMRSDDIDREMGEEQLGKRKVPDKPFHH